MSCLDNTDILRIVGGNSFQIAITVKARRVSDGSEIEDFDLSASSPVLNLIHAGERTEKNFVVQGNQAIISFSGSEGLGYYGMEMSGSYNSEAWRFCIEKVLQLVDTNAKANIPEWSFLVDDTYFIEGTISIYGGGGGGDTVQADWTETNPTSAAFILHKPDLSVYATKTEVASGLAGKQDTIADLADIREGAAAGATAYQKPASGIPESDMSEGVQSALDKAEDAYQLPANGIPASDMDAEVQAALEKANSAVQTESDPVFSNSPAAEISQADINNWNAKQSAIADLADIREGAAAGATAVQPDEMAQAIDGVEGDIEDINAKIPTAASSLNQLADKAYVNSSIATNSATYRGSFNLITDLGMNVDATHAQIAGALATAIVTADNNDYAFVQIPDLASTPTVIAKIERYKHNGSGWVYEYDLNNSGFTAAQWAAINSGITSGLVGKLSDLPTNEGLTTLLNGKQNVIADLSIIRSGASAGATAVQPADLTNAINGVEGEISNLDSSKQDVIEDLATIRSGAAAGATAYQKPVTGIPESDMSEGVQTSLGKADSAFQKPANGIPASDMDSEVQASLAKANSAVQTETDPVFSGSPAADITQADINGWNAKQPAINDLSSIREGAAAGATAVQPDEMAQAIDEVDGDIDAINAKIPSTASSLNQLADKAYVNSSIATNSATYRGSFNLITDLGMNVDATHAQIAGALATAIVTADNNDYAFVQIPDSASTPTVIAKIERYKHNGTGWVYEYDLNNSGFTAAQWAAINSGITSGLVGKLADLPNNSELATLLNGKQNVINDLSAIRSGASAGATAVQPADLTEALNGVEAEIAGLDESKQDTIEDLSTIRSGAAAGATAYQKPVTGIPESDMSEGVQTSLGKADSSYQKPSSGIPSTDMSEGVQAALEKANSAVQTETDPVFSNSPAAEISQNDINSWNAKQSAIADLADIREGAAAGATAVQPDAMAQAIDEVDGDIADINAKIPTAASNLNQLADKAYVNSSIATNSATYRGSFNLITDLGMNVDATHAQIAGALATAIVTADNNDYAFVQIPDSASTPTVIAKIERYKHNGSGWVYEYDLNNSGFTAAQWAAINSGITSGLVGKLSDLPNNSELATLLNGKQNVINDLSTIRSGAAAGATAYQKPSGGIPASDMSGTVQQELSKANTAVQTETDPIFSASPAAGITAQNIQTWNGEPAARQAADTALQNSVSTLQTDLTAETSARQTADALLQQQYNALTQSDIIVGALPATGVPNVIYRVPGTTDFTDYMWYDGQFVPMATYGLPISAEFVVDENLNKTQEEVNDELLNYASVVEELPVQQTSIDRFINSSGVWAAGDAVLISITDTDGFVHVKASVNGSSFAFLSAYDPTASTPTYAGGATSRTLLQSNEEGTYDIPDDAVYFYYFASYLYRPTVFVWKREGVIDYLAPQFRLYDILGDNLSVVAREGYFVNKIGQLVSNPLGGLLSLFVPKGVGISKNVVAATEAAALASFTFTGTGYSYTPIKLGLGIDVDTRIIYYAEEDSYIAISTRLSSFDGTVDVFRQGSVFEPVLSIGFYITASAAIAYYDTAFLSETIEAKEDSLLRFSCSAGSTAAILSFFDGTTYHPIYVGDTNHTVREFSYFVPKGQKFVISGDLGSFSDFSISAIGARSLKTLSLTDGSLSFATGLYPTNATYVTGNYSHTPMYIKMPLSGIEIKNEGNIYGYIMYYDSEQNYISYSVIDNTHRTFPKGTSEYFRITLAPSSGGGVYAGVLAAEKLTIEADWSSVAEPISVFEPISSDDGFQNLCFGVNVTKNMGLVGADLDILPLSTRSYNCGVLHLPPSYTPEGESTPLIIYLHGAAERYTISSTRFGGNSRYSPEWSAAGYAQMDVDMIPALYNYSGSGSCGTGDDVACLEAAYKWVIEHYNIRRDGVYLFGRSRGGQAVLTLLANYNPKNLPVICALSNTGANDILLYGLFYSMHVAWWDAFCLSMGLPQQDRPTYTGSQVILTDSNIASYLRTNIDAWWEKSKTALALLVKNDSDYQTPLQIFDLMVDACNGVSGKRTEFANFLSSCRFSSPVPLRFDWCVGDTIQKFNDFPNASVWYNGFGVSVKDGFVNNKINGNSVYREWPSCSGGEPHYHEKFNLYDGDYTLPNGVAVTNPSMAQTEWLLWAQSFDQRRLSGCFR